MAVVSNGTTIISGGALASGFGGSLILLSTQTASSSATISFTTGLDSTYDMYEIHFIDVNPSVGGFPDFTFQASTNGGSSYGVTATTTWFTAYHLESDADAGLEYNPASDEAQSTSFIVLSDGNSNDADGSMVGTLQLFNPSSTTYVKHFISRTQQMNGSPSSNDAYKAGYFNTTSAINALQFKFSSGNLDTGTIKLYGVKKS